MAYLYEDKELVYEKQMSFLKKRIVLVNFIIFITNFIATLILIFNQMPLKEFYTLVLPVFILNLFISYAMIINRDSHEQLYLAMYTSIIGTIVVVINIFLIEKNPATYMLIYLAIAIIGVYKDKKAVTLGYIIIFFYGTIIHFNHTSAIIGINNPVRSGLTPLLYQSLLVIILLVQGARTYFNENEIDHLYDRLEFQKENELKYQHTIFKLLDDKQQLVSYTDHYINDDTKHRLKQYVHLFSNSFYIKEDLNEKLERYLSLQETKNPQKILGNKLGGYQLKKEILQFEDMSTYKQSKFNSMLLSTLFSKHKHFNTDGIKNFEGLFMDADMSVEMQIIGFILFYDHLRIDKPFIKGLSHDEIITHFSKREIFESIDKEIVEFFINNEKLFKNIYEGNDEAISNNENIEQKHANDGN